MNYQFISTTQNQQTNSNIQSFGFNQSKQNRNNNSNKNIEKDELKRHIKITKNKGIFSLNEHNNKNVIIDTDSEKGLSIINEQNIKNKQKNKKKGTAKLLIEKLELNTGDSLSRKLLNKKNQRKFEEFAKKFFYEKNDLNIFEVFNNYLNNSVDKYKIILPQNLIKKYKKNNLFNKNENFNFHIKKKAKHQKINIKNLILILI